jgi:hypothetical protein
MECGDMTGINGEEVLRRLSSRLKMRHLILLLNIRQYGSLTRVAEQMASSQPAITSALAELESMFGAPCSIVRCAAWPPRRWASWCWHGPRR